MEKWQERLLTAMEKIDGLKREEEEEKARLEARRRRLGEAYDKVLRDVVEPAYKQLVDFTRSQGGNAEYQITPGNAELLVGDKPGVKLSYRLALDNAWLYQKLIYIRGEVETPWGNWSSGEELEKAFVDPGNIIGIVLEGLEKVARGR